MTAFVMLACSLITDVEDPRPVFVKAPAAWASKGDLTADSKKRLVAFLYPNGAKVKSFGCSPMKGKVEDLDGMLWFEVKNEKLEWSGPNFGPRIAKMVVPTPALTTLRIDMQDALRLPNGFETPPANPLVIFVLAPESWVEKGAITEAGKKVLLGQLYGGPSWMNGNSDGSTYVVKSFKSQLVDGAIEPTPNAIWYRVKGEGLEKRGPDFGEPVAPKKPESFIDHAEPGSVFKRGPAVSDAKALTAWLSKQTVQVKLPVALERAQVGFKRSGKAGALSVNLDDTRLGVSLDDRAREACGDEASCVLWLIGDWKAGKLMVNKVEGRVSGPTELTAYAWYQAP